MSIHSPVCEDYLRELLTTSDDYVGHRLADNVLNLPEADARDLLVAVMEADRGTSAGDMARYIWFLAADRLGELSMSYSGVAYVQALLEFEPGTAAREIAVQVMSMSSRGELLEYLTRVMTANPASSRAFEVAYEIWLLIGGAGVAA